MKKVKNNFYFIINYSRIIFDEKMGQIGSLHFYDTVYYHSFE